MKILHVIPSLNPKSGGPAEGVIQMARVNKARGADVEVVCLDDIEDFINDLPVKVYAIGKGFFKYSFNINLIGWLFKNSKNYDVVVVNGIWQFHSFATWLALHKSKTPYVVYVHGMLDPWFKYTYPLKHIKKAVYWHLFEYNVLKKAKSVFFTCEEEKFLAPKTFHLAGINSRVVKYGAANPPERLEDCRDCFLKVFQNLASTRNVLFFGRIHEKKGCDILIRSFSEIASLDCSLRLVLAGPVADRYKIYLNKIVEEKKLADRVVWTGLLRGELKWGAFYSSEIFVLPSHQENFGIAVAEALACGKPVIISNKVNIWREIEQDGSGLVGDDSISGTVKNLNTWLALSDEEKREMAKKARKSFEERYTVEQMASSLLGELQECVK